MNEVPHGTHFSGLVAVRMPAILLLLIVASAVLTDGRFLQVENLVNVLRQVSLESVIAFGMTLVIVTGGIDLSVGSVVALSGVTAGVVMESLAAYSPAVRIVCAAAAAITVGASTGAFSGLIIARLTIPPFIVTLAAMLVARGFAFILCKGQPIYLFPDELRWWGRGFVLEGVLGSLLPTPVVVLAGMYVAFGFLYSKSVLGRCIVAVGSNETAAYLAGIPVRTVKLIVYLLTGAVSGLAGVLHDAKLMAADPRIGEMWELNVIAAVVVGGTSLFGGRGSISGSLIGALIIGVLNNSLNLMQVEHFWQKVVLGLVILGASLLDAAMRRLGTR
jgi:ribose/xylose/arabinose/galactoside ABC-type transport system permease subunit